MSTGLYVALALKGDDMQGLPQYRRSFVTP
jgi:hypothetical protein